MQTVDCGKLAKLFNLTERRVQQLADQGIVSKVGHGQYDLIASIHGYIKYLQDAAKGTQMEPNALQAERLRKLKLENQLTEIEIDEKSRLLIPADEVERTWSGFSVAARAELLSLGDRLKSLLDAAYGINIDIEYINGPVRKALGQLAGYQPDDAGDDTAEGIAEVTTAVEHGDDGMGEQFSEIVV